MKNKVIIFIIFIIVFLILDNSNGTKKQITRNLLREADLKIVSENYFIDDKKMIKPISIKTEKTKFLNAFKATKGTLNLVCENNTNYVGTGCILQTIQNKTVTSQHSIVVYGDVTGDGVGTITDIVKMITYLEKKEGLETTEKTESVDIDNDNHITINDIKSFALHYQENKPITYPKSNQIETKIEISDKNITLEKNSSKQVFATTNKGDKTIISWKSKDPSIAKVDDTGLITAVSRGETTITVSSSDKKEVSIKVKVIIPVSGIILNESNVSLQIGEKFNLIGTITPNDADDKNIIWTSSNPQVATVNSSGEVSAINGGTATITAKAKTGIATATCQINIGMPVSSVKINDVTLNKGGSKTISAIISPSDASNKNVTWSIENTKIATVDQNGTIIGVSPGTTKITVKTVDGNHTSTANVNVAMTTKKSFKKLDSCINNEVAITGSNNSVTLHNCVKDYKFHDFETVKYVFTQNFAITDDYVYLSTPYNGAWAYPNDVETNGYDVEFDTVSRNYYIRISRADNTYQIFYIKYAGHGQSFDVVNKNITNETEDILYTNAFAYWYQTPHNDSHRYGSKYRGVSYTGFKENYNTKGEEKIPEISIAVSSNGTKFDTIKSSTYQTTNGFDLTNYYNKVISIGNNSTYMTNPEVAVDETNNRLAIFGGGYIYIYDLAKFKNGITSLIKKFAYSGGKQGFDIYGNYLYQWGDGANLADSKILRVYNITTGVIEKTIKFNVSSYYSDRTTYEAEGISIHNGKIYLGISSYKCINDNCSYKRGFNDIFVVKGL